ncbi:MAG: porphobilinogen synthase, partial [Oscillospiraceae bacterium]|nr:porphobilinogen synthase [Oscillospiraceae bacterium]
MRELTAETRLSPKDMIYPMFVVFGEDKKIPVESMP